jgi:hypothetical protein
VPGVEKRAIFYLENLMQLVLDEDSHASLFMACPQLAAICIGVGEKTWEKAVAERFWVLKRVWGDWVGTAARMAQARLADCSRDDER